MKTKNKIFRISLAVLCALAMVATIVLGALTLGGGGNTVRPEGAVHTNAESAQVKDAEGNLLVPFDLAYPDAFSTGEYEYQSDTVLLKMKDTRGAIGSNLEKLGVSSLSVVTPLSDGTVWYRAAIGGQNVKSFISRARALPEVIMADYDYIYRTEAIPEEAALSDDAATGVEGFLEEVVGNTHLAEQWFLKACDLQESWRWLKSKNVPAGGDPSVVVAVIDTGVDYDHPDLKDNMWVNQGETPNDGVDNDGNGYVDDYLGYNAVANNGNPQDDHGHGTHVAGIIAASNNKVGVVGVAYNVKIMAVKAGQASGVFTQSDIAEAIRYAYQNGADVINMSFGGSAISISVQDALTDAYTTATLVAAAGNNGIPNEVTDNYYSPLPSYPAALSYVIGVMSVDANNVESIFSNWDAIAFNSLEYEMYAPGEGIMSTLPGQKYGKLSGTSMAAPIVSGAAALLRSYYKNRDIYPSKFIAGQLAATSEQSAICCNPYMHTLNGLPHNTPMVLDLYSALTKLPKPEVGLYDYYLFDSKTLSEENTEDGVVDAGETIAIGAVLRNRWGMSKDTFVTIDTESEAGVFDPYVKITRGGVNFDSVGTYSTKDTLTRTEEGIINGVENPLTIEIDKDCPNDYRVVLNVTVTCKNGLDDDDSKQYITCGKIEFVVRSGILLKDSIEEDTVLTSENLYLVPSSLFIPKGVTVKVEKGARIQFWTDDPADPYAETYISYLAVEGKFITEGTAEEPVEIFPSEFMDNYRVEISEQNGGEVDLNYTTVTNPYLNISTADHCTFNQNYIGYYNYRSLDGGKVQTNYGSGEIRCDKIFNSVFYHLSGEHYSDYYSKFRVYGEYDTCVFADCSIAYNLYSSAIFSHCVFAGNNFTWNDGYGDTNYNSSFTVENFDVEFKNVYRNDTTGTIYLIVSYCPENAVSMSRYRALASGLGGDICCIETQEEYEFLRSSGIRGIVGLKNGSSTWLNDIPLEDDIPIINGSNSYGYFADASIIFSYRYESLTVLEIPGSIYVDNISLPEKNVELDTESTYQLLPQILPATFDVHGLLYASADESVAIVSKSGVVTPLREGEADIYIYSPDYLRKAVLHITVKEKVPVEDFALTSPKAQLSVGERVQLQVSFFPANTTEKMVAFESLSEAFAVDTFGYVTALAVGQGKIRATVGSLTREIFLTAVRPVKSIAFTDKFYQTFLGDLDEGWRPQVLPLDATNRNVTWQSSNPEVAYVEGNQLVRVSAGSVTLRATVENTDLYAELNVSVTNEPQKESASVAELWMNEVGCLSVLKDGSLYIWGTSTGYPVPHKIMDGVRSAAWRYAYNTSYLYIVTTAGQLKKYYKNYDVWEEESFYNLDHVAHLYFNEEVFFALREDGTVWSWGGNADGQLGDGTTANRDTPMQTSLKNISDIAVSYGAALFLDESGNVWATGGSSVRYTEPKVIFKGATSIEGACGRGFTSFAINSTAGNYDLDSSDFTLHERNNLLFGAHGYPEGCSIFGGKVYYKYENILIPGIDNAEALYVGYNGSLFIATADGKLYGMGDNENRQLGDLTTERRESPVRLFFGLPYSEEAPTLKSDPVKKDSLKGDLRFVFDRALTRGNEFSGITLSRDGSPIGISRTLLLNELTIVPNEGWRPDTEYTLHIPENAITSIYGIVGEKIDRTFTYINETPLKLLSQSLQEGAKLSSREFEALFTFTCAVKGEKFSQISLTRDGTTASAEIVLENHVLRLSGTLDYGEYTLTIPAGALKDYIGGENEKIELHFTVVQRLELLSSTPANGAVRIDANTEISLTYTSARQGTRFNDISLTEDGKQIPATCTLEGNKLSVSAALKEGRSYVLTLPEGALCDELGNLNEKTELRFTTYAPVKLLYSSLRAGVAVDLEPTFRLEYNGSFTVHQEKIFLKSEEGDVSIQAEMKGNVLEIVPEKLAAGTKYTLNLAEGALTDEKGVQSEAYGVDFSSLTTKTRFMWDEEAFNAAKKEWNRKGLNNPGLYGCAILNDFNDTNIEHWLRIIAAEGSSENKIGLSGNYWGTLVEELIEQQIVDFNTYRTLCDIILGEYSVVPSDTFPFVVDAYLENEEGLRVRTVSNEKVTFVVKFNRPMDTKVPLRVRFGSSEPYAEYEITGEYVTSTEWRGTYTLQTMIENGNQFIRIENGRAADDKFLSLYEHAGRWSFEIDTTKAQELVMRAEATKDGISLKWDQDDFVTLAGYNVYRSEDELGYYTRINPYVIPADTKEFFDNTVEPGKVYFYNFTVVQTDFTESAPSGKISVRSFDTMAPSIYHTPVREAFTGSNLNISALVTDNLQISSATLFYRTVGEEDWKSTQMHASNSRYTGYIPADALTTDGIEYYLSVSDGVNTTLFGSGDKPYRVTVKLAIDASSLGDVDGDGSITAKDALMLLQAVNGLYNLTNEQFARADIDRDDHISAQEALIILQYVSGKRTSISG